MQLSKQQVKNITAKPGLIIPDEKILALPEKVLQFGTGVLLRGLPDYFIDKANHKHIFNGRVVIVKSTAAGGTDAFAQQDGLYTVCIRGIENGKPVDESIINSSISRVLAASDDWAAILQCAYNPDMQIIISNTTEVGIVLSDDNIHDTPPSSFPGKLLAFLYERYKAFKGSAASGMVIVPTELITNNGEKLKSIVLELADKNKLDNLFINWLKTANYFCNSLVDRIVPGKLSAADTKATEEALGYTDDLMIMAEPFRLWAIESGDDHVKQILSFALADAAVVITPDIEKFRELKLRLLNGTHTFTCGLAFLSGFEMVKEAMNNEQITHFVHNLMEKEIAPALYSDTISETDARNFAATVTDRFSNPYLEHKWLSISLNFTFKMKLRNVPLLLRHYSRENSVPVNMALGFASYLLFMKCTAGENGKYTGNWNGTTYTLQDDTASFFAEKWEAGDINTTTDALLSDKSLWDADLSQLPGFADAVKQNIHSFINKGVLGTMANLQAKKTVV